MAVVATAALAAVAAAAALVANQSTPLHDKSPQMRALFLAIRAQGRSHKRPEVFVRGRPCGRMANQSRTNKVTSGSGPT